MEDSVGRITTEGIDTGIHPFDAWTFTRPSASTPTLAMKSAWKLSLPTLVVSSGTFLSTATTRLRVTSTATFLSGGSFTGNFQVKSTGSIIGESPLVGYEWHKVADPGTGWFASKTSGWTANDFTTGYLEVDFSAVTPIGTRAVKMAIGLTTAGNYVYWKATGDANISDTPNTAPEERSHLTHLAQGVSQVVLWPSATGLVRLTVVDTNSDLYIAYPVEYLL